MDRGHGLALCPERNVVCITSQGPGGKNRPLREEKHMLFFVQKRAVFSAGLLKEGP